MSAGPERVLTKSHVPKGLSGRSQHGEVSTQVFRGMTVPLLAHTLIPLSVHCSVE